MMKKSLYVICVALLACLGVSAQSEKPKLVVGIVVDQMRWDYLHYFQKEYGEGGLRRLLDEGYSFDNCQINYSPAVTAIGHSSVYTGSVPALTGIAGNYFYEDDRSVYCCEDSTVTCVGSTSRQGRMSPRWMLATTIGDELHLATDFTSKVVSVALKDRAAILPAGHSANAAYWWDTSAGHFVTSSYYMKALPEWVVRFNEAHHTAPGYDIRTSTEGVTVTFEMAAEALRREQLGQREGETDMLTVSISSTDAIGHKFSTRGTEIHAVYNQLDKDLRKFLQVLDEQVGQGNYLLFLTADHGASHNYNYLKEHRIPADGWDYDRSVNDLNTMLADRFGFASPVILGEDNYQFYLDDRAISASGVKKQDVIDACVERLRADKQFLWVFDNEQIASASIPEPIKTRLINGYFRGRSGEIGVVTRPQVFGATVSPTYRGTSHGQPMPYDVHIPLVFMGWHVPHGSTDEPCRIVDIAPTVCSLLHIQMPDAAVGTALKMGND